MSAKNRIQWHRVKPPDIITALSPGNQAWQRDVSDGHLSVFVGQETLEEGPRWHLSISHRTDDLTPGRYPTWDEITEARYRFVPDAVTMAMMLPPRDQYVNVHETTFHLHEETR